jgi:ABC-type phosphate transport system substrate-binding protein
MTTKADFTADEWKQIQRAPFMAGLAVVAASPSGPFGVVKEMFAVGKMLAEVKTQGSSNDLVKDLVADLEAGARDQSAPAELQGKAPDQVRSFAIESCRQAAALIEKKAKPEETQAFKQWLVSVGQKVSEAAKEGGFLGFGGTQVSEQEAATIKELSTALGIKA